MAAVYSRLTEKVYNANHKNQYKIVTQNKFSSNYTASICLHEMDRSYSTDFTFTTMRHAFNFLKKKIITFKPKPQIWHYLSEKIYLQNILSW